MMVSSHDFQVTGSLGAEYTAPSRLLHEVKALNRTDIIGIDLLDQMFARWWSWRAQAGQMPYWSEFKPFEHPRLLPNIMVFEWVGMRFRCSIVGENVVARLPYKMAHRFIDDVLSPERVIETNARLCRALGTGVPNLVARQMACAAGDNPTVYRALQLPFAAEQGKNPRILSVIDFSAEHATH